MGKTIAWKVLLIRHLRIVAQNHIWKVLFSKNVVIIKRECVLCIKLCLTNKSIYHETHKFYWGDLKFICSFSCSKVDSGQEFEPVSSQRPIITKMIAYNDSIRLVSLPMTKSPSWTQLLALAVADGKGALERTIDYGLCCRSIFPCFLEWDFVTFLKIVIFG